jgi:hypothetical protein
MRKFIVTAFLAVLGIALVVFFVANRQSVKISMDPTNLEDPAFFIGPMPMWTALAATLFIGYGLGAIGMWITNGALRRKARDRKHEIRRLKAEMAAMDGEQSSSAPGLPVLRG